MMANNSSSSSSQEEFHLSTFVVAYAYVLMCLIRAKQECIEEICITLAANVRGLLDPPISSNYFGNCMVHPHILVEAKEFRESEEGFPKIPKTISDMILELRRTRAIKLYKSSDLGQKQDGNSMSKSIDIYSIAASPKYKLYEAHVGWGKPKNIEIVSLGINNISLTDTRDRGGGVKFGLLLPNHQLDVFASLFVEGLN